MSKKSIKCEECVYCISKPKGKSFSMKCKLLNCKVKIGKSNEKCPLDKMVIKYE